jgi:hypothetical protein
MDLCPDGKQRILALIEDFCASVIMHGEKAPSSFQKYDNNYLCYLN